MRKRVRIYDLLEDEEAEEEESESVLVISFPSHAQMIPWDVPPDEDAAPRARTKPINLKKYARKSGRKYRSYIRMVFFSKIR